MSVTKLVFKTHKWLAVTTGVMTFLWFFSGVFMMIPNRLLRALSDAPAQNEQPQGPDLYRDVRISIPEAIAAVDRASGSAARVESVALRTIEGRLHYRVATGGGVHLVNAGDGSLLAITGDVARRLVAQTGVPAETLGLATRITEHGPGYPSGPLPAWRLESTDARGTIYHVEEHGGEIQATSRLGRIRQHLVGLHSLEFLSGVLRAGVLGLIMWVFSIVGTAMTLFGFWILWIQYASWRARRIG